MTRRQNRKLLSILSAIITLFIGWYLSQNPAVVSRFTEVPSGSYRVVSISDGDTIQVDMNGKVETIRFVGVDTPETHDPRKVVQCFGKAASDYTRQLIGNNPVRLEADPLSTNRDRYNRLLRYVYLPDGRLVQAEIIKNGYGFAYTSFPFSKSEEFKRYQEEAMRDKRGLWGTCSPTTNDRGGFTSNPE